MTDLPTLPEPAIANELDEAVIAALLLDDPQDEGDSRRVPEHIRRWEISNVGEAEWAMSKLAAVIGRFHEVERQAAEWREPFDRWEKDEKARVTNSIAFFEDQLKRYGLRQRALDEKNNKTTRLPSGRIETRGTTDPKVVVEDADAVIAWAAQSLTVEEVQALLKVETSVRLSHLRSIVKVVPMETTDEEGNEWTVQGVVFPATGEVVPGVSVEFPETTATVKVD